MGRNTTGIPKTDFIKIRVEPSLKKDIQNLKDEGKYRVYKEKDFIMMLVLVGLEVEQLENKWHKAALDSIASSRERESIGKAR